MSDDLDSKSDAELNEAFAVEVAGWKTTECSTDNFFERGGYRLPNTFAAAGITVAWWHPSNPDAPGAYVAPPRFTTDANAVLPWLERCGGLVIGRRTWLNPVDWYVTIKELEDGCVRVFEVYAPTFARAAVIALLRAKRSKAAPEDDGLTDAQLEDLADPRNKPLTPMENFEIKREAKG